jgi:hypothetical protein
MKWEVDAAVLASPSVLAFVRRQCAMVVCCLRGAEKGHFRPVTSHAAIYWLDTLDSLFELHSKTSVPRVSVARRASPIT